MNKLVEKTNTMGVTMGTLQCDVAGAICAATTVGNKQETLTNQLKELIKQVKKLSDKAKLPSRQQDTIASTTEVNVEQATNIPESVGSTLNQNERSSFQN